MFAIFKKHKNINNTLTVEFANNVVDNINDNNVIRCIPLSIS